MKPTTLLLSALALATSALAVDVQKSVIVSYPPDTPKSVVDQAKQAVRDGGGIVTHEYTLIVAFAAKVGEKVLENIAAWGAPYQALIEEDQIVSAL